MPQEVDVQLVVRHAGDRVLLKLKGEQVVTIIGCFTVVLDHKQRRKAAALIGEVPNAKLLQATDNLGREMR